MDRISLTGIEFFAYGGVSEAERSVGQRYSANVDLYLDLALASRSDSLVDTVDYGAAAALVVAVARERPFHLLESLTSRIADRLLEHGPIQKVTVEVRKLLPPVDGVVAHAGVQVTRERR